MFQMNIKQFKRYQVKPTLSTAASKRRRQTTRVYRFLHLPTTHSFQDFEDFVG